MCPLVACAIPERFANTVPVQISYDFAAFCRENARRGNNAETKPNIIMLVIYSQILGCRLGVIEDDLLDCLVFS